MYLAWLVIDAGSQTDVVVWPYHISLLTDFAGVARQGSSISNVGV